MISFFIVAVPLAPFLCAVLCLVKISLPVLHELKLIPLIVKKEHENILMLPLHRDVVAVRDLLRNTAALHVGNRRRLWLWLRTVRDVPKLPDMAIILMRNFRQDLHLV